MGAWFHVSDGLFFRRADDGSVEVGEGADFDSVEVRQVIEPSSWASVVAGVCARDEDHVTHTEALDFHMREA